jgi:pimeloyl-ACP methyl ester carboxylesterase
MIERTICFGNNNGLVGTLCLPDTDAPIAYVGQILFNAGIVHRVGPHRINVRLARNLARRGIPSIRFDLSGLGDSPHSLDSRSIDEQATLDIRLAMTVLGKETGLHQFSLFGFCSGGRHSFAVAPADERVVGLILYDTYAYPTIRTKLNRYRFRIRQLGFLPAVTGWVQRMPTIIWRILTNAVGAPKFNESASETGIVRTPSKNEFAQTMSTLHARGTKIGIIFSGEGDNYNYQNQFRDSMRGTGIADLVTCDYLPNMDHTIMLRAVQADFIALLEDWTMELNERYRLPRSNAVASAPSTSKR